MKNLEFLYKYYPLLVRYRRSIAASLAGLGTFVALSLLIPGPGSQTKVLVATESLAAGVTLSASDFTEKSIPTESAWDSLRTEPQEIVGQVLARSLAPNQPISSNDLVSSGLLTGLPANYVAVSLPVSTSTSSSLLNVGNLIDVYGTSNDGLSAGVLIASRARILAIPSQGILDNDPLYTLSNDMLAHFNSKSDDFAKAQNDYSASFRLLVEGLRESKIGTIKYPDANSTLRLTYGKVRSLPADKRNDAKINNYTTLDGQVRKYKKGDQEFDLPVKVLEMNKNKDYGRFADKDGSLHVNFLTDNDITGGNSGSPVLNGKGELIGLAFDGNIEAMAGDVIFDPKLQRTINVDIRYVLWVIENFSGAKHIVDEMTLVK
jgi:hypothetical protein